MADSELPENLTTVILLRDVAESLKTIKEQLPTQKSPHEQLREDLQQYERRLATVETWKTVWLWALPILVVLIVGVLQIGVMFTLSQ